MRIPITLIGCTVDRTGFDYQVRLSFTAFDPDEGYRVDAELVIETSFLLVDTAGERHELSPGTGVSLAPVLGLFHQTVTAVEIHGRGTLHLSFDSNAQLHVGPDAQYEPWNLSERASNRSLSAPAERPTGSPGPTLRHDNPANVTHSSLRLET